MKHTVDSTPNRYEIVPYVVPDLCIRCMFYVLPFNHPTLYFLLSILSPAFHIFIGYKHCCQTTSSPFGAIKKNIPHFQFTHTFAVYYTSTLIDCPSTFFSRWVERTSFVSGSTRMPRRLRFSLKVHILYECRQLLSSIFWSKLIMVDVHPIPSASRSWSVGDCSRSAGGFGRWNFG